MTIHERIPYVDVPEGASGNWRIERFSVSEEEANFSRIRSMFRRTERSVDAGNYTRLMRGSTVVMSDTIAEKRDHWEFVAAAKGVVLINGLGLGMVLNAVLQKPEVERAIVVEKSVDVLALSAPHYRAKFGDKAEIVLADALTFQPPKSVRFGAVWHDIWDFICGDNLEQMKALHRRYGRRTDWQGSWCRDLCAANR